MLLVVLLIGAACAFTLKRPWFLIGVTALCVFGAVYLPFYERTIARSAAAFPEGVVDFEGVVVGEPQRSGFSERLTVSLRSPGKGTVSVRVPLASVVGYGDLIRGSGEYLDGPEPSLVASSVTKVSEHNASRVREALIRFKESILSLYRSVLPGDEGALLGGLTLGARSDFSPGLKAEMRASGTTHLVALSGYNIGILVFAISRMLRSFLRRQLTFLCTALTLALFIVMVGFEASVVRAGIMGFMGLVAPELGRRYSFRHAFAATAAAMLLEDPRIFLLVSFQLTFLSLLGIAVIEPALAKMFGIGEQASILSWRENLVSTLAAQLAVLPLLAYYFGQFSLTSIAANVLILSFVPATMFLGFVLGAVQFISYYGAALVAFVVHVPLAFELWVIHFFSSLRVPLVAAGLPWYFVFMYYASLYFIVVHYRAPAASVAERVGPHHETAR